MYPIYTSNNRTSNLKSKILIENQNIKTQISKTQILSLEFQNKYIKLNLGYQKSKSKYQKSKPDSKYEDLKYQNPKTQITRNYIPGIRYRFRSLRLQVSKFSIASLCSALRRRLASALLCRSLLPTPGCWQPVLRRLPLMSLPWPSCSGLGNAGLGGTESCYNLGNPSFAMAATTKTYYESVIKPVALSQEQ